MCISYHPKLSTKSHDAITQKYLEKLATSHDNTCIFKKEAESLLLKHEYEIFPSYLCNVLNDNYLLHQNSKEFILHYLHQKCITLEKNSLDVSLTSCINTDDEYLSLGKLSLIQRKLNAISNILQDEDDKGVIITKESVALSLLGWDVNDEIECPLCLATLSIDGSAVSKKNLIACHKYYCPVVYCDGAMKCSWKQVVDKVL